MLNHMCASHGILEDAPPEGIHDPKLVLRGIKALLVRQSVPTYGLNIVLDNTLALVVHESEGELRFGVAALRSVMCRGTIALCQERRDGDAIHHGRVMAVRISLGTLSIGFKIQETLFSLGPSIYRSLRSDKRSPAAFSPWMGPAGAGLGWRAVQIYK